MAGSDDLMRGLHELAEARPAYDDAWSYWAGESDEVFVSPAWRRILRAAQGRFRLNIAKIPIISMADRLKVQAFTALTADGSKDPAADQVLQDAVWTANQLDLQTKRLIRSALIFGDAYWFIWPGATRGSVQVSYNDPRTTRALYSDDDEITPEFEIRRWCAHGRVRASVLYGDHLSLGWVLSDGADEHDPKSWEQVATVNDEGETIGPDVANQYGRPPIIHFRTDLPYGQPESADWWGAQDAVQKLASTLAYSGERAGLRDRYILADPAAALTGDAGDSADWDDEADADAGTRDDSQVRTGPGEIQRFTGIKAVGEWSAAEPQGFMDPANWFTRMAAMTTRTSSRYADPGGQHPSGAALRVADAPEASKAEDRMAYLDGAFADAGAFALEVAGWPGRKVDVRWKPSGIVDDLDTWQIMAAKTAQGVPPRVAMMETGLYSQDEVDSWLDAQQTDMDVARRITLLGGLGTAISQLSQGVALGLLDEGQARAIVSQTLGQLAQDPATEPGPPMDALPAEPMPAQDAPAVPDQQTMAGAG